MPKTKLVCTIGPASESMEMIGKLVSAGMNVARLNFSHGSHLQHRAVIERIRKISDRMGRYVAILQDLCGPKVRVGEIPDPGITLVPGEKIILTGEEIMGTVKSISVSYATLNQEVTPGDRILLADGYLELAVLSTDEGGVCCEVITGGVLTSHKGVNLPSRTLNVPALTEKDRKDLLFGLENDVDFVALSFVRTAADVLEVKALMADEGKEIPLIAKIEKHEAIANMDEIVEASDGIMVARGDLGVEIPLENVPWIQQRLVKRANKKAKPVIIATQMMRSMVESPRPTRAEATDIANAVFMGADAVMLSEETAVGKYPVESVAYMHKIAKEAEKKFPHKKYLNIVPKRDVSRSVAHASCVLANHLDAAAIVATTKSGFTAVQIARFRPRPTIIVLSPDPRVLRRMALYWGCNAGLETKAKDTDNRIELAAKAALATGLVQSGDTVVITAGHPMWVSGTTNMLRVKKL